ncbi:MAG: hypothetical protein Q8K97_02620 [Pseudohongiella sp.]|nr:hypothetical protein [Pseudohongiella sp.]MDP2126250.1 hypothetical protein [Pseudohongiella sp.]
MSSNNDIRVAEQSDDPYHVVVPRVPVPDLVNGQPHWLVRPSTIRLLWWIFGVVLALTVVAQIFIHLHDYFTLDGFFGFYAIFGFVSCLAMVVFAKLLGVFLKRPDTYYDDL